jgi:hypothetical protein
MKKPVEPVFIVPQSRDAGDPVDPTGIAWSSATRADIRFLRITALAGNWPAEREPVTAVESARAREQRRAARGLDAGLRPTSPRRSPDERLAGHLRRPAPRPAARRCRRPRGRRHSRRAPPEMRSRVIAHWDAAHGQRTPLPINERPSSDTAAAPLLSPSCCRLLAGRSWEASPACCGTSLGAAQSERWP